MEARKTDVDTHSYGILSKVLKSGFTVAQTKKTLSNAPHMYIDKIKNNLELSESWFIPILAFVHSIYFI